MYATSKLKKNDNKANDQCFLITPQIKRWIVFFSNIILFTEKAFVQRTEIFPKHPDITYRELKYGTTPPKGSIVLALSISKEEVIYTACQHGRDRRANHCILHCNLPWAQKSTAKQTAIYNYCHCLVRHDVLWVIKIRNEVGHWGSWFAITSLKNWNLLSVLKMQYTVRQLLNLRFVVDHDHSYLCAYKCLIQPRAWLKIKAITHWRNPLVLFDETQMLNIYALIVLLLKKVKICVTIEIRYEVKSSMK